jgi:hypothetical protein
MSHVNEVLIKPVELKINDRVLYLKYDFNAFIELEDKYGSIDEAFKQIQGEDILDKDGNKIPVFKEDGKTPMLDNDGNQVYKKNISLKSLRFLVWIGLKGMQKNITLEDAGELITFSNMSYIFTCVNNAITSSLPEKKETNENEDDASKNLQSPPQT